ncbi:hypothetical protein MSG28_005786 [Choristoneura fumiferana]|uniref:Uncharacterized protein n=1 Tax=Choristoneura fumiferana TaxID=7141 RepID=A0ACC0L145_CHOFU|nr:hypothetical protein MSG28_005786 [Choristoneura fumiferana]
MDALDWRTAQLPFIYYNKIDWGAQPARGGSELSLPVPYAVIHHSYIPGACFNFEECQQSMLGSDGAVYEGRGWHTVGAHAFGYNVQSIGIVLIGDWVSNLPPPKQLQAVQELIAVGVKLGYISSNYHVIGHRQVAATECPGESLYQEISKLGFPFYTREDWMAAPSTDNRPLKTPVPYVVIHHTYIPAACNTTVQCKADMRAMQQYHQSLGWGDIEELPPEKQLATTKALIALGLKKGYISPQYKLIGHKQVSSTECPGEKYPVRPAQERSKMKLLLVVLLIAMVVGVIVAVPAVMLSKKSILAESSENEVVTYDFPYTSRSEWDARPATEVLPLPTPVPYVVIHHSATPAACYNKQETSIWMAGIGGILDTDSVPPAEQLKTVKALIAAGVELGYIKPDYKLVGHRQVRETECPGQAFFDVVKTWDHWSPFPASHEDLVNVPEISDDYKDKYLKKSVL